MKTRLQIRGVIVDATFDADEGGWLDGYIQRGVITPESRIRLALDKCEANGDEVEVEICSPGGSVFSGIELANRIANYKGEISVHVGAFAASAAALIVLEAARAGRQVTAYRNSILLYHGAWCVTEGGRGAHADTAKLLDQINAPMKDALKAFGVPDQKVERGFEEGRQLTMTAAEAREYGILSTILGEAAADFSPFAAEDADTLLSHGIGGLAAFASEDFNPASCLEEVVEDPTSSSPPAGSPDLPGGADAYPAEAQARIAALEAENRALQSAKDKEVAAVRNALTAEIEGLKSALAAKDGEMQSYRVEMDKQLSTLHTELVDWKAKFEAESAARMALVGAVNAPVTDDQPTDWPSAVARFGAADALRLYPGLAADYRRSHGATRRR